MSDNGPPQARLGNADYQWGQFDPEAYFQHYYGEPHPDDERVIRCAVAAMKQAPPVDAELDVVDVGTGPSLIPFLCALPRARRLTAWEYAEGNIAWLELELRRKEMRSQWRHFWNVAREAYLPECPLPDDPMPLLREKSIVRRGSIFDPPRTHMGCGDYVLLCGIHYRATRRVRSRMRRLCALCKARRCFGSSVPRAFGRIYREGKPISRFATICRVNPESICAAC